MRLFTDRARQSFEFCRDGGKLFITRFAKSRYDFFVGRAFDRGCSKDSGFAAGRFDLLLQPLEVFVRFLVCRQHINGILNRHRPELLQLAPDAHAQVCGLGRQLMDQ